MEKIHFTPKEIFQKNFKQKMRGYDPNDVDTFLDSVIQDYENFNKSNKQLRDENDHLRQQVDELNKQITMGQNVTSIPSSSNNNSSNSNGNGQSNFNNATNMDILKRLSNLEHRVFGSQSDDGSHRL